MTSSSAPESGLPGGKAGTAVCLLTAVSVIAVTFSVAVSSITMGAAFVVLGAIIARKGLSCVPVSGLEAAFLLYIVAEILSSAFSVDPADSFTNMKRVLLIGVVYLSAFSFRSEKRIAAVLGLLAALGAATVIAEIASLRVINGGIERPAMFQMPMTEGGIRMLIILVLIPFTLSTSLTLRWRLGLGAALVTLIAGLVVSQTRGAWVAFLAGSLVIGVLRDRRVLAGLALLAVLFAVFAPADFRDRALSVVDLRDQGGFVADSITTTAESNVSRFQMITTGWRMFLDRPVFGWGDIGLRNYYVTYVTPLTMGEGGHLHNNLMESLVTLGAPGFCAVLYLFAMMFVVIRRAGRGAAKGSFRAALSTGILAAYVGFHVLGLFEYNFGDHEVMVLVWFLTGLAVAAPAAEGAVA